MNRSTKSLNKQLTSFSNRVQYRKLEKSAPKAFTSKKFAAFGGDFNHSPKNRRFFPAVDFNRSTKNRREFLNPPKTAGFFLRYCG